ncbi:MAG TPA: hypothetical protein VHW00_01825 [Thermoanaerobaculia bacterium]|nr:hypothetical protein [Thermoanaerobaculia bacterium]
MPELHDIVIIHDQTHAEWRACHATIRAGRIVVAAGTPADTPPDDLLGLRGATFTIVARDSSERTRRYAQVTVDRERSTLPIQIVFA